MRSLVKIRLIATFLPGLWLAAIPAIEAANAGPVTVTEDPSGILLELNGASLGDVLQRISEQSGTRFFIPEGMKRTRMTGIHRGRDWTELVRALLAPTSTMELGDDQGNLVTVRIFQSGHPDIFAGDSSVATIDNDSSLSAPVALVQDQSLPDETVLERSRLAMVARLPTREPVSEEMWNDPSVRNFLMENGVESAEDLSQSHKVLKVRGIARQLMRDLYFKN